MYIQTALVRYPQRFQRVLFAGRGHLYLFADTSRTKPEITLFRQFGTVAVIFA